ncbi:MAG: hypothetical protein JOS17DRAFT_466140 [Linnemannia elongata]|nr:MAG: hypothetical protein JOS17DRAFT_466140 [Linnemannia elongata]
MDNNNAPLFTILTHLSYSLLCLFVLLSRFSLYSLSPSLFTINTPLLFLSRRRLSRIHPPSSLSRLNRRSRLLYFFFSLSFSPLSSFHYINQSLSVVYLFTIASLLSLLLSTTSIKCLAYPLYFFFFFFFAVQKQDLTILIPRSV